MRFEWNERKNKANQKKHSLGFEEATFAVFRDKLHHECVGRQVRL